MNFNNNNKKINNEVELNNNKGDFKMQNNISNEKEILEFIKAIPEKMKYIDNEEQTKISIILPILNMLGVDTTNPSKFQAEYLVQIGARKNTRVDFAILEDTTPTVLIETKSARFNITEKSFEISSGRKHLDQLEDYSNVTENKISILTNGLIWMFFGTKENTTLMDRKPILTIYTERINNKNALKDVIQLITELKKIKMSKEKNTTINQVLKKYSNKGYEKHVRTSYHSALYSNYVKKNI